MLEQVLVYGVVAIFCGLVLYFYLSKLKKASQKVEAKIVKAKEEGVHEPVSLYPAINEDMCIQSGACYIACPEKDIIGIVDGRATLVNAAECVGHGACFHACPVEAISLVIGTEKRGVELPHVSQNFESNIPGVFIAGELGGMGLIKNSIEQGQQAVENIAKTGIKKMEGVLDLVIVGAGPAGISASLTAKKLGLNFKTYEQDSLGGTVFTFPRAKIVMTAPVELPLYGKLKLVETNKRKLLEVWEEALSKNQIHIYENTKIEAIVPKGNFFEVKTNKNETVNAQFVLLAIGRRGTPRKLGVPGEICEKVAYRLLEPEAYQGKKILVVGGGDSAVESAMLLMDENEVILSYRQDSFPRIKPKNRERILAAIEEGKIKMAFSSNLVKIEDNFIELRFGDGKTESLPNDHVFIFAGGELPTQFLEKIGIQIQKRFGYTMKSHR